MLPRAARRRNVLHQLRQSTEQLALPWLCPAVSRQHFQSTRSRSTRAPVLSTPNKRHRYLPSVHSTRHLATSTDPYTLIQTPGMDIPLDGMDYRIPGKGNWLPSSFSSADDNGPAIIIADDLLQTTPKVLRRINGIGGDASEMLANFDVSLKVGKFERAATLLSRLLQFYPLASQQYLDLHNRYLDAVVSYMIITRQTELTHDMQKWFEVRMPRSGVRADATTYATMLRMALRLLHGSRRDRTVRRYWQMVKEAGFEIGVLSNFDVLSDLDLGELSEICPGEMDRVAADDLEDGFLQTQPKVTEDSMTVRATEQKGQGLDSLRQTLSVLSSAPVAKPPPEADAEQIRSYRESRQLHLEANAIKSAIDRWEKERQKMRSSGVDTFSGSKRLSQLISEWHTNLVIKIEEELKLIAEAEKENSTRSIENRNRRYYGVYLRSLAPEKISALTILTVIHVFSRAGIEKGVKLSSVATQLGKELQDEVIADEVLRNIEKNESRRKKLVAKLLQTRKQKVGRAQWKALVQQTQASKPAEETIWPVRVHATVGALLMSLLYDIAKTPVITTDPTTKERVTTMQPAFQHSYEVSKGRRVGLIHIHPKVARKLFSEPPVDQIARHMPMLAEPKPWMGFRDGGYLAHKSQIMRCTPGDIAQELYIKRALENGGLEHVRAGLDVLGKTAWTINEDVFNIMVEAWNSGEAVAQFPALDPNLPYPPKPSEDDAQAMKSWSLAVREIENKLSGLHSVRCFQNFQIEIARAYRGEAFHLPHNVDFRGRAYPLPSYLNQMGADNARGLLLFHEGKPLGVAGLRWLKIHLSNVFGFDKASLQEREDFTMEHLDEVLDSANNGLHGRRWFLQAEDSWQCLAACCELRNALRLPDPTQYLSRLPIHQDGSCNGLQHYAALGGDVEGAQQVNLVPADRPSDVYTGVAEFVKDKVRREAAAGDPIAQMLDGRIKRKIVKQTVMTNVYGVTFVGAMRQVRRQLADHYQDIQPMLNPCAKYIAESIFEALGSIFSGAHDIQYWLGDCGNRISMSLSPDQIDELAKRVLNGDIDPDADRSSKNGSMEDDPTKMFRSTIIWTTPLGLPVVQPYRVTKTSRITTSLQDLSIQDVGSDAVVSKRKQLQAFPPNFIHSLDATHMMLSAIECYRRGLCFSAVHDSFWTHACDVDVMNGVLRDCFIRMHSDDIIERLASEFRVRYRDYMVFAKVSSKSKIGKAISRLRPRKMTKRHHLQELLQEHERQTLLRSDDPELQARGRAMVTAASVFESMGGHDSDLAVSSVSSEAVVGKIPEDLEAAERAADSTASTEMDNRDPAVASLLSDLGPQLSESSSDLSVEPKCDYSVPDQASNKPAPKKRSSDPKTWLWLPLRFRDVPRKGEFDVQRLKDSRYFFS